MTDYRLSSRLLTKHLSRWMCALLLAWMGMISSPAQDVMRRTLMTMPDSIVPFINASMMGELVEFAARGGTAEVKNKLDGMTALDTLTSDFASFSLTKADKMQVLMLPCNDGDKVICLVHTCYGPEPESRVSFFSQDWMPLPREQFISMPQTDDLIQQPDTMSDDRFRQLRRLIDPALIFAQVNPAGKQLTFSLSMPLLNADDKKALKAVLLQKSVKWNGKTF